MIKNYLSLPLFQYKSKKLTLPFIYSVAFLITTILIEDIEKLSWIFAAFIVLDILWLIYIFTDTLETGKFRNSIGIIATIAGAYLYWKSTATISSKLNFLFHIDPSKLPFTLTAGSILISLLYLKYIVLVLNFIALFLIRKKKFFLPTFIYITPGLALFIVFTTIQTDEQVLNESLIKIATQTDMSDYTPDNCQIKRPGKYKYLFLSPDGLELLAAKVSKTRGNGLLTPVIDGDERSNQRILALCDIKNGVLIESNMGAIKASARLDEVINKFLSIIFIDSDGKQQYQLFMDVHNGHTYSSTALASSYFMYNYINLPAGNYTLKEILISANSPINNTPDRTIKHIIISEKISVKNGEVTDIGNIFNIIKKHLPK